MVKVPARGFIKICGITNPQDARMATRLGASALGLNFADSPRRVNVKEAREVLDATRGDLFRCAVFRQNDDDVVGECLEELEFEMVQIHGPLRAAQLDLFRVHSLYVIKALSIEDDEFENFDETSVDAVLIDGAHPGSGRTHSWDRLDQRTFRVPVIAAGGLTPKNVRITIARTGAWGVDCASGVELNSRQKDESLVRSFVRNAQRGFTKEEE